jgi:hypothetical protein
MSVVDRSFDHPLKLEEEATALLAGGLLQQGYQCGMLWGAALSAGARAYQLLGAGAQAETAAILASQKMVASFRTLTRDEINCLEITDLNWKGQNQALPVLKFFLKGGPIGCFSMAAKYAPLVFRDINSVLSAGLVAEPVARPVAAPPCPVSCAAMLAQKVGASELHSVMAAGFAGGIGLSGGACGALGAAVWIILMKSSKEGSGTSGFENPRANAALDDFVRLADYEFECAKITGRRFENVNEHAAYVQAGGCAKIIDGLAAYIGQGSGQ